MKRPFLIGMLCGVALARARQLGVKIIRPAAGARISITICVPAVSTFGTTKNDF